MVLQTHMHSRLHTIVDSSQVRMEFLRMLGDWMLHLNERMDHEQRLMPYLLSALNDESPQIRVGALLTALDSLSAALA